jgi:N-acylneuraminate cytidylyltransferase
MSENKIIIHSLIPARGGSKSIPKKNIRKYNEYPLLVHSIKTAQKEPLIKRVVVSTDCQETKKIALAYGADVPFIRPSIISDDYSTDIECFQHYIEWLKQYNQELPDIIVHLRPTYPKRNKEILNECLIKFLSVKNKYSSLRTVVPIDKSLFKMYTLDEKDNSLICTYKNYNNIYEPYNQVRQILPKTYLHNGCIDIIKRDTIEKGSISGDKIYAFIMPKEETYDIDTEEDWEKSLYSKISINR